MKLILILLGAGAFTAHATPVDNRTLEVFEAWHSRHEEDIKKLEEFLRKSELQDVIPMHELLRTASDWKRCKAQPFEVPPIKHWPAVQSTVSLVRELHSRGLLLNAEVVSGYRNAKLKGCANGRSGSAHRAAFDVDMLSIDPVRAGDSLCKFWLSDGKKWEMGLSKYPSGRIHLDTNGYRTWGQDATKKTSFCKRL